MGHAVHYFAHRSQRNTDASGVLANNTDRAIGATDEHGFFTGGVQLRVEIGEICGRRQPLRPTLSQDVLCNILVQKLCGDFR